MNSPNGLPVLTFGDGRKQVVAVHGITASAMAWPPVARQLSAEWTLVAPDLRGRGAAAELPGPYGLRRHVEDVCAVARQAGSGVVLVGHSMGAFIALLAAAAEPDLFRKLVLVDGGLPFPPPPEGVSVDDVLRATLGPAIERLSTTFASEQAYLDFFRAHPALAADWNDDIANYARYDLTGPPGELRSRVVGEAVREDGRDVLVLARRLPRRLGRPARADRAPARTPRHVRPGPRPARRGDRRGSRPPTARTSRSRPCAEANHYTIVLAERFAARVAHHIEA